MNQYLSFTLKVILMMSILTTLLGCKAIALKGPNYESPLPKIIHVKPYLTLEYEMPTNMSNFMSFASKYSNNSPRTSTIDSTTSQVFEKSAWRKALKVDGAMWDYNIKHEATLDLIIELVEISSSNSTEDFIKNSYEVYLNSENGINNEIRNEHPEYSDEELGDFVRSPPTEYKSLAINSQPFLTWNEIDGGYKHIYYAFAIDQDFMLVFDFKYLIYIKKESDIPRIKEKIASDVEEFMSRVKISPLKPKT